MYPLLECSHILLRPAVTAIAAPSHHASASAAAPSILASVTLDTASAGPETRNQR